jgi:hypothetical protein
MGSSAGGDMGLSGWEDEGSGPLGAVAGLLLSAVGGAARALLGQPMLLAALVAALLGAVVGIKLANRRRRPAAAQTVDEVRRAMSEGAPRISRVLDSARNVQDMLGPVVALLGNPLVQSYLRRAVMRGLSSRLSRG